MKDEKPVLRGNKQVKEFIRKKGTPIQQARQDFLDDKDAQATLKQAKKSGYHDGSPTISSDAAAVARFNFDHNPKAWEKGYGPHPRKKKRERIGDKK